MRERTAKRVTLIIRVDALVKGTEGTRERQEGMSIVRSDKRTL